MSETPEQVAAPEQSTAVSPAERVRAAVAAGQAPGKRDLEHALRDIGLSARQAKKLLARGYRGIASDDSDELLEAIEHNVRRLRGERAL